MTKALGTLVTSTRGLITSRNGDNERMRDSVIRRINFDFDEGRVRPRWRGRMHLAAAIAVVPAGALLVAFSRSTAARIGAAVFAIALTAMYATSGVYHAMIRTKRLQHVFQRIDHSMIYVLIAGTFTPLCLVAMPHRWVLPALVVVWAVAACGVALCLTWKAQRIAEALYIILGWAAVIALPSMWRHGVAGAVLIVIGGLAYTVGAYLFAKQRPRLEPQVFGYHELWHVFTLIAGAAHFAAIATLVS